MKNREIESCVHSRRPGSDDVLDTPSTSEPFSQQDSGLRATLASLEQEIASENLSTADVVVRVARLLTAADGAALALHDGEAILCRASVGNAPAIGSRLQPGSGLSGQCFRTGEVVRCDDVESDARTDRSIVQSLRLRSLLIVPIRSRGSTLGIIEVLSSRTAAFTSADVTVLQHLADLMSSLQTVTAASEGEQQELPHVSILQELAEIVASEPGLKAASAGHGQRFGLKLVSKAPVEPANVSDALIAIMSAKDSLWAHTLDAETAVEREIASAGRVDPIKESPSALRPQGKKLRFRPLRLKISGRYILVALALFLWVFLATGLLAWQVAFHEREAAPAPAPSSKAASASSSPRVLPQSPATSSMPPPASTHHMIVASAKPFAQSRGTGQSVADTLKRAPSELSNVPPVVTSNAAGAAAAPLVSNTPPLSLAKLQPPAVVPPEAHLQMPVESAQLHVPELSEPTVSTILQPQVATLADPSNTGRVSPVEEEEETTPHQAAKGKTPGVVRSVTVLRQKDSIEVHIEGTKPLRASATTLSNPERILIDLDDVRLQRPRRIPVHAADVEAVSASLYLVNPLVTRVVVELARPRRYHLFGSGNSLALRIDGQATTAAAHPVQ